MSEESLNWGGDGSLDYFGDHDRDDEAYVPLLLL